MDDDEDEELQRRRWINTMMKTGKFATCTIKAKGGMGAAFKVKMATDRSERCVKITQSEHVDALGED